MKTIRTDIDKEILHLRKLETLASVQKKKVLELCRHMLSTEAISEGIYTPITAIPNRENAALLAIKYNLAIPYKPVAQPEIDYKQLMLYFQDVDLEGEDLNLLYKPKKDSIGKKRGA